MDLPLHVVLRCSPAIVPKVRYVFDTLLMAAGIPAAYSDEPPASGAWILYGTSLGPLPSCERCIAIAHSPEAWELFAGRDDVSAAAIVDGVHAVFPRSHERSGGIDAISFDLVANAFYFLSSWSERVAIDAAQTRRVFQDSVFARLGVPQDIVDRYLDRLLEALHAVRSRTGCAPWPPVEWPGNNRFAVVLSHDVDFLPSGLGDTLVQGAKTAARHLVRQRSFGDMVRSISGLGRALLRGRDPYGCIPEIIARERELGVRSSFQVAVGHRHPSDVNYRIEDDRVRDYLRAIPESGFDLCLHGSYRSVENPDWYTEEVQLLSRRLGTPTGSRQHFLSFGYDALFAVQERSGIRFDMSMGFPDRIGARAGFSYPYFPYCFDEDRPYDVLEISLFLMDVTLRSYMDLGARDAKGVIDLALRNLRDRGGAASVVWHPIVFGGARDPGYDELYWHLVAEVARLQGLATDGATIDRFWRDRASSYPTFKCSRVGVAAAAA